MKHPDQRTESTPLTLFRRKPWMTVLAVLLASLLIVEVGLQLVLRNRWASYADLGQVSAVAVDGQGQVWAAGYRQGTPSILLYPVNGKPFEVSLPDKLTRTAPSALMVDDQNRLWVGTEDGHIGMRDVNNQWILYSSNPDFSVWQMVMDGQGRVWVRSHRGPGRIDPRSGERTFSFMNSGLPESDAVALATNPEGQLWVLTTKREIKVLEADGNWRTVVVVPDTVRNGFMDSSLAFDSQGQMWLATIQGVGVLSQDGAWKEHPLGDPYRALSLSAILTDAEGRVWVADRQQGIFLLDPQTGWTNYTSRNSGLAGDANAMAVDEQGQAWIGTAQDGVSKFAPEGALPAQSLSAVRKAAETVVPVAFLSLALLAMWTIGFAQPGVTNRRVLVDFTIAFAGWFIIGSLLWIYARYAQTQSGGALIIHPFVFIPPVVNILLLILVYGWQRRMAWGAWSAFIVNWIGLILIQSASGQLTGTPFWESVFMLPFFLSL